jgi:hypothetical protein
VPCPGTICPPALADDGETLHAVFVENIDSKHDLVYYRYDDNPKTWGKRCGLAQHASRQPALAAYHGQVFCAFMADGGNDLLFVIWNQTAGWSPQQLVMAGKGNEQTAGAPALMVVNDKLHLLFAANNDNLDILDLTYVETTNTWTRSATRDAARSGVSAAGFLSQAFMGFVKREGFKILISEYSNGTWNTNEDTLQTTVDTPALAISDPFANCVYIADNAWRELRWMQRVLTDVKLDQWLGSVASTAKLSALSIPGTHDSYASIAVPYLGTQTMSITEQLNAGVRVLDLRCGLVLNTLYMFHGSVPLGASLHTVLTEIYDWLGLAEHASETIIVSIRKTLTRSARRKPSRPRWPRRSA